MGAIFPACNCFRGSSKGEKEEKEGKKEGTGETGERGGLGVKRVKKRSISEIVSEVQYEGGRLFQNGATWRILITKIYVQA